MKVIKVALNVLILIAINQSFLTACPTCFYFEKLKQQQKDHESVGEMESSPEYMAYQDYDDDLHDLDAVDGYEPYDRLMLKEADDDEEVTA